MQSEKKFSFNGVVQIYFDGFCICLFSAKTILTFCLRARPVKAFSFRARPVNSISVVPFRRVVSDSRITVTEAGQGAGPRTHLFAVDSHSE